MTFFTSPAPRKAPLVGAVIEANLDEIHNRLPRPRPRPTLLTRLGRAALVVFVAVPSASLVRRPAVAPVAPAAASLPAPAAARPASDPAVRPDLAPSGVLDASVLSQPISPGVLDLTVRRVIVDAGHGGENPGTHSLGGVKEKDLTLDIAERVQQALTARGFEAVMTRTRDETLSLQERAALANGRHGDIFVSIHLNWFDRSEERGIETYYLGPSRGSELDAIAALENQDSGYSLSDMRSLLERIYTDARRDESRRLATLVQQELMGALRKSEPAISNRGVKRAPFVVLSATEMPAILAEVSCLSNEQQVERLRTAEARQRIAEALVSGIQDFARESRVTVSERTRPHGS